MTDQQKNGNCFVSADEMERQDEFCARNRQALLERFGHRPMAMLHIYGCQQNVSDGQRIEGMLARMGFGFCDELEDADLVLYDTCAVREHAEDRVYGNVGSLKHFKAARPNRIVALCGCMMQQQRVADKIRKSYPQVDLLFGTHVIHKLPELLNRVLTEGIRVFDISGGDVIAEGTGTRRTGVKGWLPVMYGCNNFCTYCIVPYVRGRERSRRSEDVVTEAREMISAGFREITLLGQNVNSYGKTLETPVSFAQLLRQINDLDGDFIIRFMTSHPKDCSDELLQAMAECKKVAPHLHLPVQSGSDAVLRAMNRRYTREQYLALAEKARELIPDISLTSDIIVGFPGETEEDFQQTVSLVRRVGYSSLYSFAYSPRPGTPAAELDNQIPDAEKSRRLAELSAVQEEISAARNQRLVGQTFRVLAEGTSKRPGMLTGRTGGNINIEFPGDETRVNQFSDVTVTEALSFVLKGKTE